MTSSVFVTPDISVIVPARDEVVAIGPLVDGIVKALAQRDFELIVVDDGSADGTHHALTALIARHDCLTMIRNDRPAGQSMAVRQGVRRACGSIIVTLDGDGQNPPDQILALLAPFDVAGADRLGLVQGERAHRRDTLARRWASRAANAIRKTLLRDGVRDPACGMRAFRREAYLELPWFDQIHRFMPEMMLREGWDVATVTVTHRERRGGPSKYSDLARALAGIPDLLGAAWLIRRGGGATGGVAESERPAGQVTPSPLEVLQ